MVFNIFEQPWTLLAAAALYLLVIITLHKTALTKPHRWHWLIGLLFVTAAIGIDKLIETDLEKITATINSVAKAIKDQNPDAIAPLIAENYSDSQHRTKTHLLSRCRSTLSQPFIDKAIIRIVSLDVENPKAAVIFTARVIFDPSSDIYYYKTQIFAKLKMRMHRQPNAQWLITNIEIIEIDRQKTNWRDIR